MFGSIRNVCNQSAPKKKKTKEKKKIRHNLTYIECPMSADVISVLRYGENNKNEREFVQYLSLQNGLNTYINPYTYTHGVQSSLMVLCALLSGQSEGQTVT